MTRDHRWLSFKKCLNSRFRLPSESAGLFRNNVTAESGGWDLPWGSQQILRRVLVCCFLPFLVILQGPVGVQLGGFWVASASAQEESELPPARTFYLGRRIAQTMSYHGAPWLVRNTREEEERPSQVMEQLG